MKYHPSHDYVQANEIPYEYYCRRCCANEMINGWLNFDCDYILKNKGRSFRMGYIPQGFHYPAMTQKSLEQCEKEYAEWEKSHAGSP